MKRRQFIRAGLGAATMAALGPYARARGKTTDSSLDSSIYAGDLALFNAHIITLEQSLPVAQAVLIQGGRIAYVGTNNEVRRRMRGGTTTLDAGGRAVVPGFVDTHCHIEWSSAATVLMTDLHTPKPQSIAEVLDRLRKAAAQKPAGKWIVAEGDFSDVAEKRLPTLQELDSVTQQHPVAVFSWVHENVVNTLGAQGMGYLTAEDEAMARWWSNGQPFTGGYVERTPEGLPGPAYDMVMRLPRNVFTVEDLRFAIKKVAKDMFIAGGITSASPVCLLSSNEYSADQHLQALGELPLRLRAYYMCPFSADVEAVLSTGVTRGFGNDMFRTGGFKLIMDASHPGHPTTHHYTEVELADLITTIHAHGLQTMTHCTSAEGADQVTDAVEEVYRRLPTSELIHHRVEHHRARMELAQRINKNHMYFSMIAPEVPTKNAHSGSGFSSAVSAPYRSYIAQGIHPILISDKCGGGPLMPRPMFSIAAACNTFDAGGVAPPGEAVGFDDALRMWTQWAAESSHQDHDRGTITAGKFGDLAVLSHNPHKLATQGLFEIKADATILGGKVVNGA